MGILNLFKKTDFNLKVREFSEAPGAVLLDVRTREEYAEGHIPGSVNIPLQQIGETREKLANRVTPIYVHCYSGSRSTQAVLWLKRNGYTNVTNIGGIMDYAGKLETGGGI